MRKKIVCLIMTALIVLSVVPAVATAAPVKAVLSPQSLEVDGTLIDCEKYNINGSNYFKLRDIAKMLNYTDTQFEVVYDNDAKAISITTGSQYTPVGGELEQRGDYSASTVVSSQKLFVNGEEVSNLTVYNIGGNNFFKLRDLADLIGFQVNYNATDNKAIVISVSDYVGTWVVRDGNKYIYEYILNDDNTYIISGNGNDCDEKCFTELGYLKYNYETGTYVVNENGSVTFTANNKTVLYNGAVKSFVPDEPYTLQANWFNVKNSDWNVASYVREKLNITDN